MPNPRRSALSIVLAILILSMAPSTGGLAAPQAAPEDEIGYESDFWSLKEGAKFAKYYRTHALVSPKGFRPASVKTFAGTTQITRSD
jgi:hypothetical protein